MSDRTTTTGASLAACTPDTPPGRVPTRSASPTAGSRHSAGGSSCSPSREDVNRMLPSAANTGLPSPLSLRVSRRAGAAPAGSISHTALTNLAPSSSSPATVVTSRVPSGLSRSPAVRGRAWYAARSAYGSVGCSVTRGACHGRQAAGQGCRRIVTSYGSVPCSSSLPVMRAVSTNMPSVRVSTDSDGSSGSRSQ